MKRVVVVPAGRKVYLELLFGHLLKQKDAFDYLDIWENTRNANDLAYIRDFAAQYPFVRIHKFKPYRYAQRCGNSRALGYFWRFSCDEGVAYFRLDDDVVWLEPGVIDAVFTAREQDKSSWFIGPVVVNNAICSRLLQLEHKLPSEVDGLDFVKQVEENCICDTGWRSVHFVNWLHRQFFQAMEAKKTDQFHLREDFRITPGVRYSINAICYLGEDIAPYIHDIANKPEEPYVSSELPKELNRSIRIIGDKTVAHLAYHIQREHADFHEATFMDYYRKLLKEAVADAESRATNLRQRVDEPRRVSTEGAGAAVPSERPVLQRVPVSDDVPPTTVPPVLRESSGKENSRVEQVRDQRPVSRDVVGDAKSVSQRSSTVRSSPVPESGSPAGGGNKPVELSADKAKKSSDSGKSKR